MTDAKDAVVEQNPKEEDGAAPEPNDAVRCLAMNAAPSMALA